MLLHGQAAADESWRNISIRRTALASLWRSIKCSDRSRSVSARTRFKWYETNRNRSDSSRFSTRSRFTRFLRFSKCFCFLILDLLADSLFDTILLLFLSSTTDVTGPTGSTVGFRVWLSSEDVTFGFSSNSSEPAASGWGGGLPSGAMTSKSSPSLRKVNIS
ncbi:hypothetical protein LINPERPRIM_LOCUS39637 [Linum perenne]